MDSQLIVRETAQFLLKREKNWVRFQYFCVDLISKAENRDYISSSLRADAGRDGQNVLDSHNEVRRVVCASIKDKQSEAVKKAKSDLATLLKGKPPERAAFCFSCDIDNITKDAFIDHARKVAPRTICRIEGTESLSQISVRNSEVFLQHYQGELLTLKHALLGSSTTKQTAAIAMRVAVATQFGEDANDLRLTTMMNLIRLSLYEQTKISISGLLDSISQDLGLDTAVNSAYLEQAIEHLKLENEIEIIAESVILNTHGYATAATLFDTGRNALLDGRQIFFNELLAIVGERDLNAIFDSLWIRLQDGLATLFLDEGMAIVRTILNPVKRTVSSTDNAFGQLVKVILVPSNLQDSQVLEIGRHILNILSGDTKTRAWLCQVATIFVSVCSLGLHPGAQEELLNRLRSWVAFSDTHVLLSYICGGENDHHSVKRIMEAWHAFGRKLSTSDAVLEEAAYHAYIAKQQYISQHRDFKLLDPAKAESGIHNAFLRDFFRKADSDYSGRRWNAYINNYVGQNEFDGSVIKEMLVESGWVVLDDTNFPIELVTNLEKHLSRNSVRSVRLKRDGSIEEIKRHSWDARVALVVVAEARKLQNEGGNVIVLTRSASLKELTDVVVKNEKMDLAVMSVAALGYSMALLPGKSVSLADIRELLFDRGRLAQCVTTLEATARRLVDRDSNEAYGLMESGQLRGRLNDALTRELARNTSSDSR